MDFFISRSLGWIACMIDPQANLIAGETQIEAAGRRSGNPQNNGSRGIEPTGRSFGAKGREPRRGGESAIEPLFDQ